jgi:uracil-DNA glycosylase
MIKDFFKPKDPSDEKKPAKESQIIEEKPSGKVSKSLGDEKVFPDFDTFREGLGTWEKLLAKYAAGAKFKEVYKNVKEAYEDPKIVCYPPVHQIFNCFQRSKLADIKVVIVGQDPYHQPGQAMGLCFSVNKGIPVPPSLVNIYKCIKQDPNCPNFKVPTHGDLTKWADQGVLLINTVLTVQDSTPNAHQKFGWLDFTNEVIKVIANELENVIFLLWGKPAEKKAEIINNAKHKHHILTAVHPSPLSASKGFFECQHFSKVNDILRTLGKPEIDWQI